MHDTTNIGCPVSRTSDDQGHSSQAPVTPFSQNVVVNTKALADNATHELNKWINRSAGQHMRAMREQYELERDAELDPRDIEFWERLE